MDSLSSILPKVLRRRGLYNEASASQVVFIAQRKLKEMLPELADFLKVEQCKDGTLLITATHSIAAQEIQGVARFLLEYLKKELAERAPLDIRIQR